MLVPTKEPIRPVVGGRKLVNHESCGEEFSKVREDRITSLTDPPELRAICGCVLDPKSLPERLETVEIGDHCQAVTFHDDEAGDANAVEYCPRLRGHGFLPGHALLMLLGDPR